MAIPNTTSMLKARQLASAGLSGQMHLRMVLSSGTLLWLPALQR